MKQGGTHERLSPVGIFQLCVNTGGHQEDLPGPMDDSYRLWELESENAKLNLMMIKKVWQ